MTPDHQVINMDCLKYLETRNGMEPFDCIFADGPDNLGLDYGKGFSDKVRDEVYFSDLCQWIKMFTENAWTTWISFNAKWTIQMSAAVFEAMKGHKTLKLKPCVQVFTFGRYTGKDLSNDHRPLWRLSWEGACKFPDNVRVRSARQERGDSRANPEGKIPGDVFDFPIVLDNHEFPTVFEFPRVVRNSKQRRKWCPTQLHEGLVERCIKLSTNEGMSVYDPFAGSGTTLRVCKRIGRRCVTTEVNADYVWEIAKDNDLI